MKIWMYVLDYKESDIREDPIFEKFYGTIVAYVDGLVHFKTDTDVTRVLYAITNNKDDAKKFEATHDMSKFTKIKDHMTAEEWEECAETDAYKLAILVPYYIHVRNKKLISKVPPVNEILMTGLEANVMDDEEESCDLAFTAEMCLPPYQCINPEYIPALDALLYCTAWAINSGSEDIEDKASYDWSYKCTYEGFAKKQLSVALNVFEIYIDYFEYILLK